MQRFFAHTDAADREYQLLATSTWAPAVEARHFIEAVWPNVAPVLDEDLPAKAARLFRPHFWELYLAASFQAIGFALVPRRDRRGRDAGPDLLLTDGTAIEAVVAQPGVGPDAVTDAGTGIAVSVPDDAIRLRLLNAIDTKRLKADRYVTVGVHAAAAPFVVALNGALVPYPRSEHGLPRIVRALLPLGHLQVHLRMDRVTPASESDAAGHRDASALTVTGTSYAYEASIAKASGARVQTDAFFASTALLHRAAARLGSPLLRC